MRGKRIALVVREMAEVAGGAPPARGTADPDPARCATRAAYRGQAMQEQPEAQSIVFVVDDDASLREALKSLLRSVGLRVEVFGSAADFLKHKFLDDAVACLVLDIRLPGLSGLDFQAELAKAGIEIPIIFISGHGDIPMTVRAMKAGAVEFLTKPFRIKISSMRFRSRSTATVNAAPRTRRFARYEPVSSR